MRPVIFMAYSGQMRWRTSAGEEMAANLGEGFTKDITSPGVANRPRPQRRMDSDRARGGR